MATRTSGPRASSKIACSLCKTLVDRRKLVSPQKMENHVLDIIRHERPEWDGTHGGVLLGWMALNTWVLARHPFDPYPAVQAMARVVAYPAAPARVVGALTHRALAPGDEDDRARTVPGAGDVNRRRWRAGA